MKLLITTDGSEESKRILRPAADLAAAVGAEVVLARVFNPRTDAAGEVDASLAAATRRVVARWQEELEAMLAESGMDGATVVLTKEHGGDLVRAIVDYADEIEAGMIAMSSRGTGRLRQAILGSVALGILGRSSCPVMVVGAELDPRAAGQPYHILATTDGSEAANAAVRSLAALEAPTATVHITLMRAMASKGGADPGDQATAAAELDGLAATLPQTLDVTIEARTASDGKHVDEAIVATAKDLGADALWIGTHGHSMRARVFAGSTALGILEHSRIPVILVRK